MTGSKHNHEGNNGDCGEPEPGPYWKRMHRDWRFWIGALFMAAALAIYVLSGDLAWVPHGATGFPERLGLASHIKTASLKPKEEERAISTLRNSVGTSMGERSHGAMS